MTDNIAAKVERLVRDMADVDNEVGRLWDATELANLDLDDLRNVVGELLGYVRLTRLEFRRLAAIMLELCAQVGVWDANADAIVEHLEHLIEDVADAD